MSAAIYCRFSTDRQSETSIEDQARVCTKRATELGIVELRTFADQAVSGSTRVGERPGGRALLAATYDVLILEGLDRLSRDQVEQEAVVRRLEHRGVRIIGVSDGYDTASGRGRKLLRGMRGLMNEAYLDDLREKTHRGLEGQVVRGYHAGGLSFGYRSVVAGLDGKGEPIGHRLEVDPAQADVVRWIFARYAAGQSCQRIAAELNSRSVPGPRGGTWCVSALYGSPAKGSGVLNNELYIGRYVWNRSRWVKDPDTKRRQRFVRPAAEWRVDERPQLRILSDDEWQAVRTRMDTPRNRGGGRGRSGMPTTLFGGMLRCGLCGGAVVAVSARLYGCATRKDRGATVCQGLYVERKVADARLVTMVRDELLAPAVIAELEVRIKTLIVNRRGEIERERGQHAARRLELERQVARLTDAIAEVGISPALSTRLQQAEAELAASPRTGAPVPPDIATGIRTRLRALALDLSGALGQNIGRARSILRGLLGDVRLVREGPAVFAEVDCATDRLLLVVGGESLGRVAGTRNLTRLRVR